MHMKPRAQRWPSKVSQNIVSTVRKPWFKDSTLISILTNGCKIRWDCGCYCRMPSVYFYEIPEPERTLRCPVEEPFAFKSPAVCFYRVSHFHKMAHYPVPNFHSYLRRVDLEENPKALSFST